MGSRFSFLDDNARELALLVRRNLKFLVWFAIFTTLVVFIITISLPQEWRLNATLQVTGGYDSSLLSMMSSATGVQLPSTGSSTQAQVLRSRFLREKAIASEAMQIQTVNRAWGTPWGRAFRWCWNKIPGAPDIEAEYVKLGDAVVPQEWSRGVLVAKVTDSGGLAIRAPGGSEKTVEPGGKYEQDGLSFKLREAHAPAGRTFGLRIVPLREANRLLSERTGVYELGLSSGVLAVVLTWRDQFRGADYLNALVKAFTDDSEDYKRVVGDEKVAYLDAQIEMMKRGLATSEEDLSKYKRANATVEITEESKALIQSYASRKLESEQIAMELKDADMLLARLKNGRTEDFLLYSTTLQQDAVQVAIMQQLATLAGERAKLMQEMTTEHPSVKAIDAQISETKSSIMENLRNRKRTLESRQSSLGKVLGGYEGQMLAIPGKERDLTTLMRDRTVYENLYIFLVSKRQEVAVLVESQSTSLRALDKAIPPEFPLKPSVKLNFVMGLLLGFLFALAYVALRHYGDGKLRNLRHAYSLGAGKCIALAGPGKDAEAVAVERLAAAVIREVPAGGTAAIVDLAFGFGERLAEAAAHKLNSLGHKAHVATADARGDNTGLTLVVSGDLVTAPLHAEAAAKAPLRLIVAAAGRTPAKAFRANAVILSRAGALHFILVPSALETEDAYTAVTLDGEVCK